MTIGLPDPKLSYPKGQALYPIPVRYNKYLSPASFRFPVARNTLAFDYEIPVITALWGLTPVRFIACPAHFKFDPSRGHNALYFNDYGYLFIENQMFFAKRKFMNFIYKYIIMK